MITEELSSLLDPGQVRRLLERLAAPGGVEVAVRDAERALVAAAGDADGPEQEAPIGRGLGVVTVRGTAPPGLANLVAEILVEQAATRVELDAMAGELLSRYEELTLLYELSSALASVFEIPELCDIALGQAVQVVDAEKAYVALLDDTGEQVYVVSARGAEELLGEVEPVGIGLSGYAVQTGRQVLLHEGDEFQDVHRERWPGESVLTVAIVAGREETALGAMTLAAKAGGQRFTAGDAKLANAIATQLGTAIRTSRLVSSLREAERVRQEVEIAAGIQRALLPREAPRVPGVQLAGRCVPSSSVGGDYFDFMLDPNERVTLLVADVAGHSIGSALMMAMARTVLRSEIGEGRPPAAVLEAANAALYDDLVNAELFITICCARYDQGLGRLTLASAAHNPALLVRATGEVLELDPDGMAAGMIPASAYEQARVDLGPGDAVLLYTDGVTEARDADGNQFGEERLKALVATVRDLPAAELVERIFDDVRRHTGAEAQQDDVTLVALTRDGSA